MPTEVPTTSATAHAQVRRLRRSRARRLRLARLAGRHWPLLLILALAAAVRWSGIEKSVWEDEVHSFIESRPGADIVIYQMTGATPAAYATSHALFRFCDWLRWTGSIAWVRLPMIALALAGIAAAWAVGALWRRRIAGGAVALVLAFWPFKANWDVQVRYYCVLMALMMLMLWAWERYRARRRLGSWSLAIVITVLGALSHIMALVLLAAPWIYLAWDAVRGAAWVARRPRRAWRRGRVVRAALAQFAVQLLALLFISGVVVQLNRGPEWVMNTLAGMRASRPGAAAAAANAPGQLTIDSALWTKLGRTESGRKLRIPDTSNTRGKSVRPPSWKDLKAYGDGLRALGRDWRGWRLGPLLSGAEPEFITELAGLPSGSSRRVSETAERWLVVAILAGVALLLFTAPPMALTLCAWVVGTVLLIKINPIGLQAARYYTMAGFGLAVLAGCGLGLPLEWLRRPLRRRFRRLHAAAGAVALAALLIAGWLWGMTPAREGARAIVQDWLAFYRQMRERFPGGTLAYGIGAKSVRFYHELDLARERRQVARGQTVGYWQSAARDEVIDPFGNLQSDLTLLEQANGGEGVAWFFPSYWSQGLTVWSQTAQATEPAKPIGLLGIRGWTAALGRRVYVTRGAAAVPLMPRTMAQDAETSGGKRPLRFSMNLLFEVPGLYDFSLGAGGLQGGVSATLDGRPLTLAAGDAPRLRIDREPPPGSGMMSPETATADTLGTGPLLARLDGRWLANPARAGGPGVPIDLKTTATRATEFVTPGRILQPMTLELTLDAVDPRRIPVLSFIRRSDDFTPVSPGLEAGAAALWQEPRGLAVSVPIRLTRGQERGAVYQLNAYELGATEALATHAFDFAGEKRRFVPGEMQCVGPLLIEDAKLQGKVGKGIVVAFRQIHPVPTQNLAKQRYNHQHRLIDFEVIERNGRPALQPRMLVSR